MAQKTLLVVDDEAAMRRNVHDLLSSPSLRVLEAEGESQASEILRRQTVDVVLLDFQMPGTDGIVTLKNIKRQYPDLPVIMFTAFGTNERVIEAMEEGAYDYIDKPFDAEEIQIIIARALEYAGLLQELKSLRSRVDGAAPPGENDFTIIGQAPCMQEIFKQIGRISSSEAPVLIEGESGTGKEVIADAIQRHSPRSSKTYVKVNCAAFAESLLESEIFGHEKGAFTGATDQRQGHFETANGGTLLLDEITGMSRRLQARLLRVLQHGTFFRVGGNKDQRADVRLISLSNRKLEEVVESGRFRSDLFYRINVIRINVPSLRERMEDVPLLARHFVQKYARGEATVISDETMARLVSYSWPGNVRELENVIQSGLAISSGDVLHIDSVPTETGGIGMGIRYRDELKKGRSLKDILSSLENQIIREMLADQRGNRSRTAKLLGVHRRYLYSKMKQYKIR
jgi:two-component system response regulator AtoC